MKNGKYSVDITKSKSFGKSSLNLDIGDVLSLRITFGFQRTERNIVESLGLLLGLPIASLTCSKEQNDR